jgi:hypothetical protein
LLQSELAKLDAIRQRVEASPDPREAQTLMRDAHDLLSNAERDAAAGLLDAGGIDALRSLHHVCWLSMGQRGPARDPSESACVQPAAPSAPAPPDPAAPGPVPITPPDGEGHDAGRSTPVTSASLPISRS